MFPVVHWAVDARLAVLRQKVLVTDKGHRAVFATPVFALHWQGRRVRPLQNVRDLETSPNSGFFTMCFLLKKRLELSNMFFLNLFF